jgi:hypothetical protein
MEHLKFEYLEDEDQALGTYQGGNKGCIAKFARRVMREVMKRIN